MAALILQGNVPLEAVAIAGEVITTDARICSYDKGVARRASLEKWSEFAEAYELLLRHTRSAIEKFGQNRDGRALVRALEEIEQSMTAL